VLRGEIGFLFGRSTATEDLRRYIVTLRYDVGLCKGGKDTVTAILICVYDRLDWRLAGQARKSYEKLREPLYCVIGANITR
jgi:hypothetical protein